MDERLAPLADIIARDVKGPLTASLICREALMCYRNIRAGVDSTIGDKLPYPCSHLGDGRPTQRHVAFYLRAGDRNWSLYRFATEYIRPAMRELSRKIPFVDNIEYEQLELPGGFAGEDVSGENFDGIYMRTLIMEVEVARRDLPEDFTYINPRFYKIDTDEIENCRVALACRFDVRLKDG